MFKKLVGLLTVAVAGLFLSGVASAQGLSGSAHDFTAASWNTAAGEGEMCAVCHTPHNANSLTSAAPLWDRSVTATTFTLYPTGGTLDATMAQPAGVSQLCLSCHDGSIALDTFGGKTGTTFITGAALVGTDLSNDHPVSFTYNTALATLDGGLFNPSVATTSIGGTIAADLLFTNSLECGSCHDVHDSAGNAFLLTIDNAGSALCNTCHDK